MAAPIPSEVKSAVAFIFVEKDAKPIPNGTAFFLGVKNTSKPDVSAGYLITAKHVICKPKSTDFLDKVFVRLNKKDGDSEFAGVPIVPQGPKRTVFTHSDPLVDIAVIPCLPDVSEFDVKFLPDDMITTKEDYEKLNIREGSEVFFTGLFLPFPGAERNYPVVRFGRVALVTDEKITWKKGKDMDLYLIEADSYGGNSGAPVFFYLGSDREPGKIVVGKPILKLAGIMKGSFGERRPLEVVETNRIPVAVNNVGIAAVVPAYKLHEILFSDEVKKHRGF